MFIVEKEVCGDVFNTWWLGVTGGVKRSFSRGRVEAKGLVSMLRCGVAWFDLVWN